MKKRFLILSKLELIKLSKENGIDWNEDSDGSSFCKMDELFPKWVRVACRELQSNTFNVTWVRKSDLDKVIEKEVNFKKADKALNMEGENFLDFYCPFFENVYEPYFGICPEDLYVNAYDYILKYISENKR